MKTFPVLALLATACALTSAPTWAAKPAWLSCDPAALKFKPTITLQGESPAEPGAEKQTFFMSHAAKGREAYIQDAVAGKFFLGLQGLYLNELAQWKRHVKADDWSSAKIFGIEHPLPAALSSLVHAFSEIKAAGDVADTVAAPKASPAPESEPSPEARSSAVPSKDAEVDRGFTARLKFLADLADNPRLREAWKLARKEHPVIPNTKDEQIGKVFDQVAADPAINPETLLSGLPKDHAWRERVPFIDVLAGVQAGYAALLRKPEIKRASGVPARVEELMPKFFQLDPVPPAIEKSLLESVTGWRQLFMAAGIAGSICKAGQSSKNIVAVVDKGEVEAIKRLLRESLGSSIRVDEAKSEL